MKLPTEIRGDAVLLLGYGREGKSTHAWLKKQFPSVTITIADRNTDGEAYLGHIDAYDTVIRSPGVSPYLPEIVRYVKNGGHLTSATNIFFSLVGGLTIGITGTKGKSTTTSLIAHILDSAFADVRLVGNIGNPMLDALDGATADTVFVIELSSHQLADLRYSPHVAVVLGIVSEHLDYYPDLATYANAKANIVRFQTSTDVVVYNPEHTIVRELVQTAKSRRVTYNRIHGKGTHTFVEDGIIVVAERGIRKKVISLSGVPLIGNVENVLAAVTVADLMHMSPERIAAAIQPFKSLPHRLEFVGEFRGVRFFNDSLATIPQATVHALEALGEDVETLIAGGYDRHLDYALLGAYLRSHPVSTLLLFPDTGEKIRQSIGKSPKLSGIRYVPVRSMEDAVRLSYQYTPKGKICLLSPASASYNMFRDYEDRGNQFREWVRKLGTIR